MIKLLPLLEIEIKPKITPKVGMKFWFDVSPPYGYWNIARIGSISREVNGITGIDEIKDITFIFRGWPRSGGMGSSNMTLKSWNKKINDKSIVFKEPTKNINEIEIQPEVKMKVGKVYDYWLGGYWCEGYELVLIHKYHKATIYKFRKTAAMFNDYYDVTFKGENQIQYMLKNKQIRYHKK